MGLDSVELVMDTEDRFNIKLADSEVSRVRTVAELAALVMAHLPTTTHSCPSARGFYQVRRLLTTHAGIPRENIQPNTRLEVLFPADRRRTWNRLHSYCSWFPRLEPSKQSRSALAVLRLALIAAGLIAVACLGSAFGLRAIYFCSLAVAIVGVIVYNTFDRLSTEFPRGLTTIGDLSRMVAPIEIASDDTNARQVAEQHVVDEVRRLTAEKLNLPLEEVRPESDFKRLGLD